MKFKALVSIVFMLSNICPTYSQRETANERIIDYLTENAQEINSSCDIKSLRWAAEYGPFNLNIFFYGMGAEYPGKYGYYHSLIEKENMIELVDEIKDMNELLSSSSSLQKSISPLTMNISECLKEKGADIHVYKLQSIFYLNGFEYETGFSYMTKSLNKIQEIAQDSFSYSLAADYEYQYGFLVQLQRYRKDYYGVINSIRSIESNPENRVCHADKEVLLISEFDALLNLKAEDKIQEFINKYELFLDERAKLTFLSEPESLPEFNYLKGVYLFQAGDKFEGCLLMRNAISKGYPGQGTRYNEMCVK